eukprot:TRINITY_DN11220_c0_g1_i1.p1 TRINITY_DN11220_c0_g1~~TRINITY_DN11220_c0_g1_i1.p1  ORF type:complete len:453 (+),score=135.55 TRINITY_DN11220_c0_g1_i1:25-1359(+)
MASGDGAGKPAPSLRHRLRQSDPWALLSAFLLGAICMRTLSTHSVPVLSAATHSMAAAEMRPALEAGDPGFEGSRATIQGGGASHDFAARLSADDRSSGAGSSASNGVVRGWLAAQFRLLDSDGDGLLDTSDVVRANRTLKLNGTYVNQLRGLVGNREMSFEELATIRRWLRTQFQLMDMDEDGKLDAHDLSRISRKMKLQPSHAKKFRNQVGDRELSFEEFMDTIKKMEIVAEKSKHAPDTLPPQLSSTVMGESISRATLLLGLMILQSGSAMVLARYEALLKEHMIVMLFLTMLVGAGGNVGNQSVIKVIEQLLSGSLQLSWSSCLGVLMQQLMVGAVLATILGAGGFFRAFLTQYYFRPPGSSASEALRGCVAVGIALMVIVVVSAVLGTAMPLLLAFFGLDVAHAGPTIQVVMDIGGVVITCSIARLLLEDRKKHLADEP